ncbi:hypothetical protein K438DRAFT_1813162 [Mycena galopus ATCC 62051]|nr:hypothetical protein K438DRAFT_1813162 [Mycena galopus ATCC 62051]
MILRSARLAALVARPVFNVASRAQVHLSHIGSKPIPLPSAVKFDITPTSISIEGPLGKTTLPIFPFVKIDFPPEEPKMMLVTGFAVRLFLEGVGYRVAMEEDPRGTADGGTGRRLNMKLGYSHPVFVPIPPYIKAEVPAPTKIQLFCTDKHQLGLFAAKVQGTENPNHIRESLTLFDQGIFIGNETRPIKSVKKK